MNIENTKRLASSVLPWVTSETKIEIIPPGIRSYRVGIYGKPYSVYGFRDITIHRWIFEETSMFFGHSEELNTLFVAESVEHT